jgi:tRNA modification GTPase
MDDTTNDTIAAIATGPGEAGLAVIRLSGPASAAILERIFHPTRGRRLAARRLTHGWVVDPASGARIDEALAVRLPGPHSYTAEDVAEIHCHGGRLSPRRVIEAALAAGARLAEPGEFSLRAFLNGRIDLAQAEALLDLVQARTERARQLALEGVGGRLSAEIKAIRAELLVPRAELEARIDFADEDLPEHDVQPALEQGLERLRRLLAESEQGLVYRQGPRVAIVGRPNVGKSSLLNALLRAERAIVTPEPGTTRDTVEETASLGGIPFWLVDTAGLRPTSDPVERIGVDRGRAALASADLVLLVLDASQPLEPEDRALIADLATRDPLVALNKSDLPPRLSLEELEPLLPAAPKLPVSAMRGGGLPTLERLLVERALGGPPLADPLALTPRQRDALRRAADSVAAALNAAQSGWPAEIQAGEVAAAIVALGEISGENATEDLLDTIFSRFCIGK